MHMMLPRNLPYTEQFIRVTNELITGGIVQMYRDDFDLKHLPRKKDEQVGPQVLTLQHLGLGFYTFLIVSGLGLFVFLLEMSMKPCKAFAVKMFTYFR